QSQSMAVEVKPFPFAEPGKYPIKIKVNSPNAQGEAELMVLLTGTYKLDAGTATGLLSLAAFQGKEANLSFYVKNNGSAAHNNVRFLSFKPENWKVEFKPEKIETLAPGDLKQVELTITPADQALVGDYSVNLSIEGEKANKNMELRVTVKTSTVWGWMGIGIIVIVIAGLVVMFFRLGRR
ncbi:MAG: NEW3 domain-containing protein, partial [Desulfatiglandales bacterium]